MDKENIKEELKVYVELLKIFSAFVIALGGGLGALFVNLDTGTKAVIFLIGSIVEVFFIVVCLKLLLDIYSLIRRLRT